MPAEAVSSGWHCFHSNQINIVNEILQNLRGKKCITQCDKLAYFLCKRYNEEWMFNLKAKTTKDKQLL